MVTVGRSGPRGELAWNMEFLGRTDMNGRPDAVQITHHIVNGRTIAWVGHMFSSGVSAIDITDPRNMKVIAHIPSDENTWNTNAIVCGDLLVVSDEYRMFRPDTTNYFEPPPGIRWDSGLRVYDVGDPANPKFLSRIPGVRFGAHRGWFVDGRYLHVSNCPDESFLENIYQIFDLEDPTRPREVGRWWLPGMWSGDGQQPAMRPGDRWALHHPIVAGNRAYTCWWDAGFVILDISDYSRPKMISRLDWSPPYGGATHTALPLLKRNLCIVLDEAIANAQQEPEKLVWVVDIRDESNPVTIATFPEPKGDFLVPGARFGPHNLHENRPVPGAFSSDTLIFQTYFAAGLRVYDIASAYQPREVAYYVAPPPEKLVDHRPGIAKRPSSQDVLVTPDGVCFITDYNAGLYAVQFNG